MREVTYPAQRTLASRGGILWALFGNEDDPLPPADYMPGALLDWRMVCWWFRNPAHNLCFYVLGACDRPGVSRGIEPTSPFVAGRGWNWCVTRATGRRWPMPFVSYRGRWVMWYVGWRPIGGAFGLKLRRNSEG